MKVDNRVRVNNRLSVGIKLARALAHLLLPNKRFTYKQVKIFAQGLEKKNVLEIGSGNDTLKSFFPQSTFIESDLFPSERQIRYDVTKSKYKHKVDAIICASVLEHIYEFEKALNNMFYSLNKGGKLLVIVPFLYPLHSIPFDFWRFSEFTLTKKLEDLGFKNVKVNHNGLKRFPISYAVFAVK